MERSYEVDNMKNSLAARRNVDVRYLPQEEQYHYLVEEN
jgi:hypothetical protein